MVRKKWCFNGYFEIFIYDQISLTIEEIDNAIKVLLTVAKPTTSFTSKEGVKVEVASYTPKIEDNEWIFSFSFKKSN